MHHKRNFILTSLMALSLGLSGCELLYFAGGKGSQEALFTIPKDKRVLVLVDSQENVAPPPSFSTALADKVSTHLFRNNAVDHVVSQDRIIALQQEDPAAFKKMGVADIATAADADVVLVIYVTELSIPVTADGTVAEGEAQVQVKVIDRNGVRLWPGDVIGTKVEAHVESTFTSEKDKEAIVKELTELLSVRTGRMFHAYNLEDKSMTK